MALNHWKKLNYLSAVACKFNFFFHTLPAYRPLKVPSDWLEFQPAVKTYRLLRPTYGILCFCNMSVLTWAQSFRLQRIMVIKGALHWMSRFCFSLCSLKGRKLTSSNIKWIHTDHNCQLEVNDKRQDETMFHWSDRFQNLNVFGNIWDNVELFLKIVTESLHIIHLGRLYVSTLYVCTL